MDHIAIMKKSWGLTEKILTGEKTIESRWHKSKSRPWGRVKKGDTVYFKNSGEPVRIKSSVEKVLQFSDLSPGGVKKIIDEFGSRDGIADEEKEKFLGMFKDKKYCILVFLKDVKKVEEFNIDKRGFGAMSAWVTVDSVKEIKKRPTFMNLV